MEYSPLQDAYKDQFGTAPQLLVRAPAGTLAHLPAKTIDHKSLLVPLKTGIVKLEIGKELNKPLAGFGTEFWQLLAQKCPEAIKQMQQHQVQQLTYTDRYLASPQPVLLLRAIIKAAPLTYAKGATLNIQTHTNEKDRSDRWPKKIHHNWRLHAQHHRKAFIEALLQAAAPATQVQVTMKPHLKAVAHARGLTVAYTNGNKTNIQFDYGMGYWQLNNTDISFPFDTDAQHQLQWANNEPQQWRIDHGQEHPTVLYIDTKA